VRIQRELLFAIFREVLDRAAQERGALKIFIRLSRRGETQELAIYHDGDSVIAIGARDDALRRLVYQARAMGNQVEIRPRQRGRLQVICRW
jgi:ketosteroid isomerase-like protein